jgi:hypothetical protein
MLNSKFFQSLFWQILLEDLNPPPKEGFFARLFGGKKQRTAISTTPSIRKATETQEQDDEDDVSFADFDWD